VRAKPKFSLRSNLIGFAWIEWAGWRGLNFRGFQAEFFSQKQFPPNSDNAVVLVVPGRVFNQKYRRAIVTNGQEKFSKSDDEGERSIICNQRHHHHQPEDVEGISSLLCNHDDDDDDIMTAMNAVLGGGYQRIKPVG
jgi:hypothetical protein